MDALREGGMRGRLGDSGTSTEAELFAMFAATLSKVQAKQEQGRFGGDRARGRHQKNAKSGSRSDTRVTHKRAGSPGNGDTCMCAVTCGSTTYYNSRQYSGRDGGRGGEQWNCADN
eukprot:5765910-Pleurochrysis_carterae.AAC.3